MFRNTIDVYRRAGACLLLALGLTGCMSSDEVGGALIGGTAGAVIGNQFGKGDGNKAAIALGAIIGASVGQQWGASLDESSRDRVTQATTDALRTDSEITWENPGNASGPASGRTVITRRGTNAGGATCREYRNEVMIGDQVQQAYGTACRDANGDWKIVS